MADMLHSIAADRVLVVIMSNGLYLDHASLHDTTMVCVEEGVSATPTYLNVEIRSTQLTLYNSSNDFGPATLNAMRPLLSPSLRPALLDLPGLPRPSLHERP